MIRTAIAGVLCLLSTLVVFSQPTVVRSYAIPVTDAKTTNIIFPYEIISVDRGHAKLLAQQAPGVKNILQVKAADAAMPTTNVSVVTADGQFYSFLVHYDVQPALLNISFAKQHALLEDNRVTADTLEAIAQKIKRVRAHMCLNRMHYGISLRLLNVFADSTGTWLSLRLRNLSYFPFTPESVRCYVKPKKAPKRTAVQEMEIAPVYADVLSSIGYSRPLYYSISLPSMAFKRSQRLYVELREAPGARMITLPIAWRTLARARKLPSQKF
jgi:conjugative transposon TraN protein